MTNNRLRVTSSSLIPSSLDIRHSSFKVKKCAHAGSEFDTVSNGPAFSWQQN
jgi:hypothetical protein